MQASVSKTAVADIAKISLTTAQQNFPQATWLNMDGKSSSQSSETQ
jgi:hypothetical protein